MFPYAQTNLQLYRQLTAEGYAAAEIGMVAGAHEVALRLFPGTYRGSGKPFLSHLVGTASVLASLRARTPVLVTGLLHAVYTHGEFGNGWRGMSDPKRAEIRRAVGGEIEDLIARYTRLLWSSRTIPEIRARLDTMTPVERDVLLVRLANELEITSTWASSTTGTRNAAANSWKPIFPPPSRWPNGSGFPRSPRVSPRPSRRWPPPG